MALQSTNRAALKEWAVVCRALEAGVQSILLRKGGLDEGLEGFHIRHREFWFLPTRFHEGPESLAQNKLRQYPSLLDRPQVEQPAPDTFRVAQYGVVEQACEVIDIAQLDRLAPLQILSVETLHKRFHYRQPGVSLIVARVYRLARAQTGIETPDLAGCRSWAELPSELSTAGASPVLTDEEFSAVQEEVSWALNC